MKKFLLPIIAITALAGTMYADATPAPTPSPMQSALVDILQGVTATAGQAKDFLIEQTPDVVRQLLVWKATESAVFTLMSLGLFLTFFIAAMKGIYGGNWNNIDGDAYGFTPKNGYPRMWTTIVFATLSVPTLIGTMINLFNPVWLQIWLAPKVYLIEYASSLVK